MDLMQMPSGDVGAVLRPSAVLPESAAREALVELAHADVRRGGCWYSTPHVWERYDRPWAGPDATTPGDALLIGRLFVSFGLPTRYAISVQSAQVTALGVAHGWTVEALCDEALLLGGYTLAECPRADLRPASRVA